MKKKKQPPADDFPLPERLGRADDGSPIGFTEKKGVAFPSATDSDWEEVQPSELRVGDFFIIYGMEVGRVKSTDKKSPEAGLVYEWNGRELTGLRPRKKDEGVSRLVRG